MAGRVEEAAAAARDLVRREGVNDMERRLGAAGQDAHEMVSQALDRSEVETSGAPPEDARGDDEEAG